MQTILLIHGTADAAANWHKWERWLSRRGWRTVSLDLPGHGTGADGTCDSSVAACRDFLLPVLEREQPQVILGHSLGGTVAIELALKAPVAKLLLVCPAVAIPQPTRWFYDWFVEWPLELTHAQRHWLLPLLGNDERLVTAGSTAPAIIRQTWQSLRDWQAPDWSQLTLPVAIVGGYWDPIAPPAALAALRRQLPAASLTILPCRHKPMDSAPAAFERWLARQLVEL